MEKISILTQDEVTYLDNNMYQTPFIIYDQQGIEENTKRFYKAFDRAINFQNYFAIKACPNPTILNILTKI
jgi:diaminopimelate decarboxylase